MAAAGYLLETKSEPRVRRARDVGRVGLGLALILITSSDAIGLSQVQRAILRVSREAPDWAEALFWIGYGAAGILGALLLLVVLLQWRKHPDTVRDVLASITLAALLGAGSMRLEEGVWPSLLPELGLQEVQPLFPIMRVAVVTALILALSPHVSRALRRLGIGLILLAVFAGLGLGFGFPTDAVAGVGIGLLSAGAVLLVFGSPIGFPKVDAVAEALEQLGVEVADLEPELDQSWGTRRFLGVDGHGMPVEVKAYGRDAVDTQLAAKVWRTLWYRDTGPAVPLSRMQSVEHEALMSMMSGRHVSVTETLTAGRGGDDVAVLALSRVGTPLSSLASENIDDRILTTIWTGVARLHEADIAHGALTLDSILIDEGDPRFHDFAAASLGAGDLRHLDTVTLLFDLSEVVGVDRAVAAALSGLGRDQLGAALPYFQLPSVSRPARRRRSKPKSLMTEVRTALGEATGVELPEPTKLRRVSIGSLLTSGLMLFAAYALINQLAGIDFVAVWEVVQDSAWLGLFVALAIGQSSFVPEATALIAAVGRPISLRPVVVLQFATKFISLAIPSAAGRIAMNTSFMVKQGVKATVAVVQGAIESFSGFAVEALVLLAAVLLSEASFDLGGDVNWQRILIIAVGVSLVGVALVFVVEKIRRVVVPVVRDAVAAILSVLKDPKRTITMLGSNLGARVLLGLGLWMILLALGVDGIGIPAAITVTVATNLLAGLAPVPGGIGVAEATMIAWLVLIGVPEASAFAATIVFRMWTFYLPAFQGFFALRWLENRDYL